MIPAIVLAGGLGTRLRAVVPDVPKPMATVAEKPFLWWLLRNLQAYGVERTYLSVGYKREVITEYFGERFDAMQLEHVPEVSPLGTGGAIANVFGVADIEEALVLNGDTIAAANIVKFVADAKKSGADIAMAVAHVGDVARYGAVQIDSADGRVTGFMEKGVTGPGYINAGVYIVKRELFARFGLSGAFSFERDLLGAHLNRMHVIAFDCVSRFIDIGVPEDYARAQTEVPDMIGGV
ncbi:TPA: nucleotidyltransferase family protein [Burkholderia multivorans]|uniref:nucleotidyltransferase family protein n=1 Tax=Burkholderia multivorans TaxID=87883 RepID=UPI000CFEE76F|nr:nucleotidyltransferase family protein [Burkholderia multivorans]MBU9301185.1 nucleotidyltransferase family protein [Burkholderia multivorans]MBU9305663.1 nucleotidyltransferase family protein [Burkholderia multivorans]MBU9408187.1 nucleotidyltransferase family protein [Burkholderia multivorans]MBU9510414.1 nucleotidyltransferase family protein [Burkholderia multivorans]MCA8462496.1 nucleotidyltransferase family protein [Burkholderia multivorans]